MHLYELPLVFALIGLALYAVLAGADFGAGFWQLFAGRGTAGRTCPRPRPQLDGAGLGGQSRLADLRPHRRLDGLPDGVWLDRLDPVHSAVHRRRRDHLPRWRLCAASRDVRRPASCARSTSSTALASIITPFALGAAVGGIASGRVPVGNAAGDLFSSWLNPTSILIGVLAVATAAYLAAVYLAADAVRLREPDLERHFRTRALALRRRRRSNRARRPGRAAFRRPSPLQRSGHGRRLGCADRLDPRRAGHPGPGLEAQL